MTDNAGGDRLWIPSWNGDPSTWIDYRQEVRLYQLGENLEVSYSIASRLVGRLRGAARRVGLVMDAADLFPDLPADIAGDQALRDARAERNRKGIATLLARLEKTWDKESRNEKEIVSRRFSIATSGTDGGEGE